MSVEVNINIVVVSVVTFMFPFNGTNRLRSKRRKKLQSNSKRCPHTFDHIV